MTKYIDADRLRAEIEKLDTQNTSDLWDGEDDDQCYGYDLALDHIKRLIDTLQQEQPEADLEKEIEKYYYDNFAFISSAHTPTKDIVSDIAYHFYELRLNARKEE